MLAKRPEMNTIDRFHPKRPSSFEPLSCSLSVVETVQFNAHEQFTLTQDRSDLIGRRRNRGYMTIHTSCKELDGRSKLKVHYERSLCMAGLFTYAELFTFGHSLWSGSFENFMTEL